MRRADDSRRPPGRVPPADWNLLFEAVMLRLREWTGQHSAQTGGATIDDCLRSMDLLRAALDHERDDFRNVRAELSRTRADLAASRAELSAAQAAERAAWHQSQHDGLTELPNRSQFRRRLDDALDIGPVRPPQLAVLFMDLDDFKPINDRYGHDAGDELLCIVARRLRSAIRAEDIVCRLGGDEFACLLSQPMGRQQLSRLAGQLVDAVAAPLTVGPDRLSVRPSIGIAVCPTDGDTTRTLLQRADAAMYRAKRGCLGFAFFDGQVDEDVGMAGSQR